MVDGGTLKRDGRDVEVDIAGDSGIGRGGGLDKGWGGGNEGDIACCRDGLGGDIRGVYKMGVVIVEVVIDNLVAIRNG